MYNELQHHGIDGQKWGRRNGPPYPLSASDHSSAERKAGTSGWTVKAKKESKKKVRDMSDEELRKVVERKRLENRYKSLKRGNGSVYNTIKGLTDTAGEIATTKFGKKSPEVKIIGKARRLEDQSNAALSKARDARLYKDVRTMSDAELKRQSDRLQLERDYRDLNPTKIQNGMKVAAGLLEAGVALYVISKNLGPVIQKGEQFISKYSKNTNDQRLFSILD